MSDELRSISLLKVLEALGHRVWRTRKEGREHYGKCPIHGSKKNATSFSFNADGKWHCFSCNSSGRGSIDLTMKLRSCSYKEACEWLSETFGTPAKLEPKPVEETPYERTENPTFTSTYHQYQVKSSWLEQRGLTPETLNHYGVFEYSNPARKSAYNNKIFIPIRRFKDSELVGYLVRNPNNQEEPKYLWPKGILKGLEVFGSQLLKGKNTRYLYLVESPFAVMKFHQLGLPAVSCYGWSVSPQQLQILQALAKGLIYLPDRNVREQALASVLPLLAGRLWVKSPPLPAGIDDPEHLTLEQIQALT